MSAQPSARWSSRNAAILLDVNEYEKLMAKLDPSLPQKSTPPITAILGVWVEMNFRCFTEIISSNSKTFV